jgi:uncharacterized oxidoreductase
MNLSGNTILITGGSSGIGLSMAEYFLDHRNTVIACARRQDRLDAARAKLPGLITRVCDVSKAEERQALADWAISSYPDLNVLINNAGIQQVIELDQPVDSARIQQEIDINLVAPIHLSTLFAQHLAAKANGVIANVSSGLAFVPVALMPVYCATKAALHSATISLRHQLRGTSVKVFEIIPPSTDTDLGHERRPEGESHGGIPVQEFLDETIEGLKNDELEMLVGHARNLKANPDAIFEGMNKGFDAMIAASKR